MSDVYKVIGGSGDGRTLTKSKLPPIADGQTFVLSATPGVLESYQRSGDSLVFVSRQEVAVFIGGPCDGGTQPLADVGAVAEGGNAVVPIPGTDRYAYYRRTGYTFTYEGSVPEHELELVEDPPQSSTT